MRTLKILLIKLCLSLIIIFFLYGCSYNNIYRIDSFNGKEEIFIGVADVFKNEEVSTVNMVFVHGMGFHPFGEKTTKVYQDKLAEKLGFSVDKDKKDIGWAACIEENPTPCVPLKLNEVVGGHLGWRKFQRDDGKALNMFELSWDKATELIQKQILELDENYYEKKESTIDREKNRALINKLLKKFMNSRFADPAIYLGYFGEEIRKLIANGLSKISELVLKNSQKLSPNLNNQIVLISDSLGSSVVFDTVAESRNNSKISQLKRNQIEQFASHTTQIYMNANQLPLIELGRIRGPQPNETASDWLNKYPCSGYFGLPGFSDVRNKGIIKNKLIYPLLEIVAFSDPNDALTYHLTKRFKNHCGDNKVRIINVTLTNAHWNWLFILANPFKAHASGFKNNERAIELIINGNN